MPRTFEENLALYARLAVLEGLALQSGQELIVSAEIGSAPLVRLIAAEAYRAGAKNVEVLWSDPGLVLSRFREGSEEAISYAPAWLYDGITRAHRENAARLGVLSSDPGMLAGIDPSRVATSGQMHARAKKEMSELISASAINWSLIGAASPEWAARVFPGIASNEAVDRLWDAIFLTSRIHEPDPIAAWVAHSETLERRVVRLNELRLDALRFRGPGTDLRVGLVEGHLWGGGRERARNGVVCSPNIPTEEVFTMPHRRGVDGVVSSTKPLGLRGQIVDGIEMEFRDGAVVRMKAAAGEETLRRLVESDEGAARLGEVALVPNSSKVSEAGILFLNSLYDENAASHIALGASYGGNLEGSEGMSEESLLEQGANDSMVHVDWMIGSAEVDVDGERGDGSTLPLMRSGEWV